jgi:hypothetical protein
MKISFRKYQIAVFLVLLFNLTAIYVSSSSNTSTSKLIQGERIIRTISSNHGGLLKHGISNNGIFTNDSFSHDWILQDIKEDQIVYFRISPENILNVTVLNPSGINYDFNQKIYSTKVLGSWTAKISGNWTINVNDNREVKTENITYTIMASIPEIGYNEESAIWVSTMSALANFTLEHETHYWKIFLEYNQNGTLFLTENITNVLEGGSMLIYRSGHFNNPEFEEVIAIDPNDGLYVFPWNANYEDTYYIVLTHNDDSPVGEYNITASIERYLFNFATAGTIPSNQTVSYRITQGFTPAKKFYFKFQVNLSRVTTYIRIYGPNSSDANILEDAMVEIFDGSKQRRINRTEEGDYDFDKQFSIILRNLDADTYYLVFSPQSGLVGQFYIHFRYTLPKPFSWSLLAIVLSTLLLFAFPSYLIYLDSRGKWYQINQWSLPISLKEAFKFIGYSFRGIFDLKEVPDDSILIRIASIPFRTYLLLNFIESSVEETLVFSKRIRRKMEWILYFLVGFIIFDAINIFLFLLDSSVHLLPVVITDLSYLLLFLAVPTVILAIGVLFVNVSAYISYNQVISRVNYIVQNYQETTDERIRLQGLDPIQASKTINYVRVLWNQAKHAFKENNFELFVIKADASVKNLLSTRYLQIVAGNTYSKPDFQNQVVELRKRGFDLPNDKKISHFRNLRNRIVHSSVTLGEKESVDCFAYYSTFITRLGLRPT